MSRKIAKRHRASFLHFSLRPCGEPWLANYSQPISPPQSRWTRSGIRFRGPGLALFFSSERADIHSGPTCSLRRGLLRSEQACFSAGALRSLLLLRARRGKLFSLLD